MNWIIALAVLVIVVGLYLVFVHSDSSQQYPDWVIEAFEEFDRNAEEDSKLSEIERIMKYFPDAKVSHEGNKTTIDLGN